MQTQSITLATLFGGAATCVAGGPMLQLKASPLGADGLPSVGAVRLSSGDTGIAKVTTAIQDGAAPAGVIGIAPGSVIITATSDDVPTVTTTLAITVT